MRVNGSERYGKSSHDVDADFLRYDILNIFDRMNLFRGRDIWPRDGGIHVHSSVKVRMDDPAIRYRPRARWPGEPNWVD